MKRPRIAFWIKWHGTTRKGRFGDYVPAWLWYWAERRVNRWHDSLLNVHDDPRRSTTLIGKLHK